MTDHSDWEFFQDEGYFGMWCVREKGARRFGEGFHTVSKEEAEALASALSSQSLSLSEARAENDRKDAEIERLKKLSDRYGVALMMIRAGCSDPARFAGNILDDRQPVNVELDEEDFDENHR